MPSGSALSPSQRIGGTIGPVLQLFERSLDGRRRAVYVLLS
jgi:hypothetical protein